MFSPQDLKEEVDHSFFDSDCDDGSIGKDRVETVDKSVKADEECLDAAKSLKPDELESGSKQAEEIEDSCEKQEEKLSRKSSISSIACSADNALHNASDVEDASSVQSSEKSNETFLALLAGHDGLDDEDGYHQSQDESEEEEDGSCRKYSGLRASSPKKLMKHYPRSPSPTSSEADDETYTDSSSESPHKSRHSREPSSSTRLRMSVPTSSSGSRGDKVGSAKGLERATTPTEESEDTVTDVTPLSTPDSTPLQSLDLTQGFGLKETAGETLDAPQEKPPPDPTSPDGNAPQEEEGFVDECSLGAKQQGYDLVPTGGRRRKNYSFSNEEVRRIDHENQRLLRGLTRLSTRPGSAVGKSHTTKPPVRLYHTAVNRQKEQQRIERENMAFLKKLETVKPTPGLSRSEQLSDYERHGRFSSVDPISIYTSSTKKDWSHNRTPSGKSSRVASAAHSSTRASFATVEATRSPVPRSHNNSADHPAWC